MISRKIVDRLLGEVRRGYDLVQERRADEAVAVCRDAVAEARKVGLDSAYLHYALAMACDDSGELEMAFEQIRLAVAKDPLAPPFRYSFDAIAGRIHAALADPERRADDPSTPRLYALLQRAGAVDVGSHLAMVRYHLATGKPAEARALVDALTLLHPASREAWEAKAHVAEATGDAEAAAQARLEVRALPQDPLFAVPGRAAA